MLSGTYQPHALFRNNGDGTFTNVADAAGIADPRGGWGSLFADYDNDGDVDLYITRGGWSGAAENTLYHNNGDGTFTDVTHAAGVADPQSSFCAAWADYDNDGYIDLYIADGVIGDGAANVLYRNNGDGTFTNTAAAAGVADTGNSLGTAWGITIRTDISTCMSSTLGNPMCFTAITAMAPSPMSPRRPV